MLRIAALYADQWDTFAAIPGSSTDGVEADTAEHTAALDAACREVGRDPNEIRRSTWVTSEALRLPDAYLDFVRRHHRLGFTDFTSSAPHPATSRSGGRSPPRSSPSREQAACSSHPSQ